jgi:hypothetical protein
VIEVVRGKPPVYDKIVSALGEPGERTVFTYGEIIYAPSGEPPADVMEHEKVHVRQQEQVGRDWWWEHYLEHSAFRASQELEAYRVQYQFLRRHIKDRNELAREAFHLARTLAGPIYGRLMSFNEALKAIREQQ